MSDRQGSGSKQRSRDTRNPLSSSLEGLNTPNEHAPSIAQAFRSIAHPAIPDRGHRPSTARPAQSIMDPFEVRIRFTQHLQHLNASVTSANKAAQYALKYRDMDEDLHSCILEQLERVSHLSLMERAFVI